MKSNVVSVSIWGQEICKLEWRGGYKPGFGKLGAVVSFASGYASLPWDLDPLGFYSKTNYMVREGLSDWCRATQDEGIPRFISGSLPDEWGNAVFSAWASRHRLGQSKISAVDKLAFIGKRGMGALEYVPEMYQASDKDTLVLEDLYVVARQIQQERETYSVNLQDNPAINDLMAVGMSAGGKHPKAIVAINWETGDIRSGQIPLPAGYKSYILKFKDADNWPTSEVEYAYYLMALKAGIEMTPCQLLDVGGEKHFLTQRFDRNAGKKIHAATLYALCGPVSDYADVFRYCRELGLPAPQKEQLFRRMVFNFLAGVCDDHDKNTSFIMEESGMWRLAPAYDETFTVNVRNPFIGDRHAMSIYGEERAVTQSLLMKVAEENDIKKAKGIISEVLEAVRSFPAEGIQIPAFASKLISEHIQSKIQKLNQ